MTTTERAQAYSIINAALNNLTDDELKAIVCIALTGTTANGTPITKL